MKIPNKEITVSNRFIYYYANLVQKTYGFVLRRDGENIPREHYIGRIAEEHAEGRAAKDSLAEAPHWQGDPHDPRPIRKDRWTGEPEPGEIALFLYRKRLMLGSFRHRLRGSKRAFLTEDDRRIGVRRSALIYLTGVTVPDDPAVLKAYAASVRALAAHIDLREIWESFREDQEALSLSDIAALYWAGDIDPSRWIALYLHLESACPCFERRGDGAYLPLKPEDMQVRKNLLEKREALTQELAEFLYWLSDTEAYDPDTLTPRQQGWLRQVRSYVLWGSEAQDAARAKAMLSEIAAGKSDLQRYAFDLLVRKGVWSENENLDLVRADIPLDFPGDLLDAARKIDLDRALKGRKRFRGRPLAFHTSRSDDPELAFSLRRRWLRGYELGVHIPDVAALVPPGSALDRAASDRMAALHLPDREVPMLPPRISDDLARFAAGEPRPALSLLWKLDRNLNPKFFSIRSTSVALHTRLSEAEAGAAFQDRDHPMSATLRLLDRIAARLRSGRTEALTALDIPEHRVEIRNGDIRIREEDPSAPARKILTELSILAAAETGRWCVGRNLPAIYETRDDPENPEETGQVPHPVVRRHEVRRQTPPAAFSAEPGAHAGLGVETYCAVLSPGARYPDLMVQRQVLHYLKEKNAFYATEDLDPVRYRAQEEFAQLRDLQRRRERHLVLKQISALTDRTFSAVALHIRRDGVLVELAGYPLKTVVHPQQPVSVGDELRLRLAGVDLWRSQVHFLVL